MIPTHYDEPTEISSALVIPGLNIGILESLNGPNGTEERKTAGRVQSRDGITVFFTDGTARDLFPQLGTAYVSIWGLPHDIEEEDIAEYFEETLQELEAQAEPEPEPEPIPEPEPEPEEIHPEGVVAIINIPQWDVEGVLAQWNGEEWMLMGTSDSLEDNHVVVQYYARFVEPGETVVSLPEYAHPDNYRKVIELVRETYDDVPEVVDNLYEILESFYTD